MPEAVAACSVFDTVLLRNSDIDNVSASREMLVCLGFALSCCRLFSTSRISFGKV